MKNKTKLLGAFIQRYFYKISYNLRKYPINPNPDMSALC